MISETYIRSASINVNLQADTWDVQIWYSKQIIYSLPQTDEGTVRPSKFQTISLQKVPSDVELLPSNPSQSWTYLNGSFLSGHVKTTRKLYLKEIKLLELYQSHMHLHPFCHHSSSCCHAQVQSQEASYFPRFFGPASLMEKHFYAWQTQKFRTEVLNLFHMKSLLLKGHTNSALHKNHTSRIQLLCHTTLFSGSYLQISLPQQCQMHYMELCSKLWGRDSSPWTTATKENQGPKEIQVHKNLINDGNKDSVYMYIHCGPPEQSGFVQLCCMPQAGIQ